MKNKIFIMLVIACVAISCGKSSTKPNDQGFSQDILNILPQKTIDSLEGFGMTIYSGKTPPNLVGVYYANDFYCSFDNTNSNRKGQRFLDEQYTFYNQDNSKLTISVDYKTTDNVTDISSGNGAFVSGNGKNFSIFVKETGVYEGIHNQSLLIISGTMGDDGIANFQQCYRLLQKDPDPTPKMVAVGGTRIFYEKDGLASKSYVQIPYSVKNTTFLTRNFGLREVL